MVPHTVVMKVEISFKDPQNILYQAENMLISAVKFINSAWGPIWPVIKWADLENFKMMSQLMNEDSNLVLTIPPPPDIVSYSVLYTLLLCPHGISSAASLWISNMNQPDNLISSGRRRVRAACNKRRCRRKSHDKQKRSAYRHTLNTEFVMFELFSHWKKVRGILYVLVINLLDNISKRQTWPY